ncbi:MAG: CRISPR-associated ring nuclease Csm6 [Verrucomicrobiales bacterium]
MPQTILLAVTGLSPAVVTETVWALARENPSTLPSRVVFITTGVGAARIKEQLHSALAAFGGLTAWQALRTTLKAKDDELIAEEPRLIGRANKGTGTLDILADIQTPEENDISAGFILEEVRRVTMNPDTPLIASIAGGRKTMGALLYAAVTLIGRETDRLTHVLVNAPYEGLPGFYFPDQPGGALIDHEGKRHAPAKAIVQLADVPFVPLRNRFDDLRDMPGSFSGMVRRYAKTIKQDAKRPVLIEIGYRQKCFWVDGAPINAGVRSLAILHFLLTENGAGRIPIGQPEAAETMQSWLKTADFIPAGVKPAKVSADDIRHDLSELRKALKKAAAPWQIPQRSLAFSPTRVQLRQRT